MYKMNEKFAMKERVYFGLQAGGLLLARRSVDATPSGVKLFDNNLLKDGHCL
jgi:hypothetical protein